MKCLAVSSIIPLKFGTHVGAKLTRNSGVVFCVRSDDSRATQDRQQQLNLSVLRFTFGIPGFDESYLPRWIGYGFGSLLLLNHFVGSYPEITPAQLRTEAVGLSLAAFSVALPYFGRFLKGATTADKVTIPPGAEQIFVMSQNIADTQKEDLAWATYVLLRNTNTIAALICVEGELCVRGYWNTPDNYSKAELLDWFKRQIEIIGLSDLKDPLYFPKTAEFRSWEMLPEGTCTLLVEPLLQDSDETANENEENKGFLLLASSIGFAYSDKDRAWIRAVANKFVSRSGVHNCSEILS